MPAVLEMPVDIAVGSAPTACHLFPLFGNASRSYCGVPREEQEFHRIPDWTKAAPICSVCGNPRCPICLAHHLRDP